MKERPILFSAPMVRSILEGRKTVTRRVVKPYRKHPIVNLAEAEPTLGYSGRHNDADSWGYEFLDDGAPASLSAWPELCPYGQPGDRLWVRETWGVISHAWSESGEVTAWEPNRHATPVRELPFGKGFYTGHVIYAADGPCEWAGDDDGDGEPRSAWKPSIHMPRAASRITLEVIGVRVERLYDITPGQAIAEGIEGTRPSNLCEMAWRDYAMAKRDPFEWFGHPVDSFHSLWVSINGIDSWNANPWVWVIEFKRVEAQTA